MPGPARIHKKQPRYAAPIFEVARSLPQWFNAEGLESIARDVAVHEGFVARDGAEVVGFALWRPLNVDEAELSWLGVRPAFQHRGTGTRLLSAVCMAAGAKGVQRLLVSTVADNVDYPPYADTRRFYRARGFNDLRVDRDYFGNGTDRYDRLMLVRAL